ncbi:Sequestrin [Plasmodium coatneyi]|uniref:Sequestrin n=1 Tax=Plasmodium coatneyi TaxID=208452 RepID=A0A1B1DTY1_9APIC|nr:Sequestrin [Plasmodium coatneyi]ANQ06256.1 Sequestrin [Plasmodium coatneyi]
MWDTAYLKRVTLISFFLLAVKYLEYYSIKKGHRNERTSSFAKPQADALGHYLGGRTHERKTLTSFPAGFPLHSSSSGVPQNCPKEDALSVNGYIKRNKKKGGEVWALDQSNLTLCYNGVTSHGGESCAKPVASARVGAKKNNCACSDKDDFYKNGKEKNAPMLGGKIVNRIISHFFKLLDECAQVKRKLASVLEVFLTRGGTHRSNFFPPPGNLADGGAYTFMDEDKIYNKFFYHPYVLPPNGYLTTDGELFPFHYSHSDRVGIINSEGITNGRITLDEWLEKGTHELDHKSTWDRMRCKIDPLGGSIRGMSSKMSGRRLSDEIPLVKGGNKDGQGDKGKDDRRKDDDDAKKNTPLQDGYTVHHPPEKDNKKKRICRLLSPQYMYQIMPNYETELEEKEKKKECINCRILSEGNSKIEDKDKDEKYKTDEQQENDKNEKEEPKRSICRILQENDKKQSRSTNNIDGIRANDEILRGKDGASSKGYRQFRILLEQDQRSYSSAMGKGAEGRKNQRVNGVCGRNSRQLAILQEHFSPDDDSSDMNGYDGDGIRSHDGSGTNGKQFRILADSPDGSDVYLEIDGLEGSGGSGGNGDDKNGGEGGDAVVPNSRRIRILAQKSSSSDGRNYESDSLFNDTKTPKNGDEGEESDGSNRGNGSNGRQFRILAQDGSSPDDEKYESGGGNEGSSANEDDTKEGRTNDTFGFQCRGFRVLTEEGSSLDGKGHGSEKGNEVDVSGGSNGNGDGENEEKKERLLSHYRRPRNLAEVGQSSDGKLKIMPGGAGGHGGTGSEQGNNGETDNNNCSDCRRIRILMEDVSPWDDTNYNADGGESGGSVGSGSSSNIRRFRILVDGDQEFPYNDVKIGGQPIGGGVGHGNGGNGMGGSGDQGTQSDGSNNNGTNTNSRQFRILAQKDSSTGGSEDKENEGSEGSKDRGTQSDGNNNEANTNSRQFRILAQKDSSTGGSEDKENEGSEGSKDRGTQSDGNNNETNTNSRQFRILAQKDSSTGGSEDKENEGSEGRKNQGTQSDGNDNGTNTNSRQFRILAQKDSSTGGSEDKENEGSEGRKNQGTQSDGNDNGTNTNSRQFRILAQKDSSSRDTNDDSGGKEGPLDLSSRSKDRGTQSDGNNNEANTNSRQFRILAQKDSSTGGSEDKENEGSEGRKNQGTQSDGNDNGTNTNSRQFRILTQKDSSQDGTDYDSDGGENDGNKTRESVIKGNGGQGNESTGNYNGNGFNSRKLRILAQEGSSGDCTNDGPDKENERIVGRESVIETSGNQGSTTHRKRDGQGSSTRQPSLLSKMDQPNKIINGSDELGTGVFGGSDGGDQGGEGNGGNITDDRKGVLLSSAILSSTDGLQKSEVGYKGEGKEEERLSKYLTGDVEKMSSGYSTKGVKAASETEKGREDRSSSEKVDMSPRFKKYDIDEEEEEEDEADDEEEEEEEELKKIETNKGKYYSCNINETTQSLNKVAGDYVGSAPDRKANKLKRLIKGSSGEWGDSLKSSSLSNYGKYGNYGDHSSQAATHKHASYKHLFSESAYIYRRGNYYFINPSPFSIVKMKQQEGVRHPKGSRDYMDCYATWFSSKHNSSRGNEYAHRHIKQIEELLPGSLTGFKNNDGYMRLLVPSFVPEDTFLHCLFRSESYHGMVDGEGHVSRTESYPVKIYLKKNLSKTKGCSFQVKEGNVFHKEYAERESFLTRKIIMNEKNSSNNECVINAFNEIVGFQCGPPYYRMDKKEKHTLDGYNMTSEKKEDNLMSQGVSKGAFFMTDPPYCFEHVNENQNVMDILPGSFPFPSSNMLAGQIEANHTRYIKVDKFSESKTIACYCNYYKDNSIMYSGKIIIKVQPSQDAHLSSKGGHLGESEEKVNFVKGVEKKKGAAKEDMNLILEKRSSHRGKNYDSDRDAHGGGKKGAASTEYTQDMAKKNFISNINPKHKEGINSIFFKKNMGLSTVSYDVIQRFGDKFKGEYVEEVPLEDTYREEGDSAGGAYTDLDGEADTQEYDDEYTDAYTDSYADPYGEPYDDAHTDPYSSLEDDANGDFLLDLDSLMNENAPSKYKPLDGSVDLKDSIMHAGESQTITVINKSKNVKLMLPQLGAMKKTDGGDRGLPHPKVISVVYEEKGNKHENVNKSLKLFKEFFPPVVREPEVVDAKKNVDVEDGVDPLEGEKDIHEEGKDELIDEEQDEEGVGEWIEWDDRKDGKFDKDGKDMRDFNNQAFSKVQKNETNNTIDGEISDSGDDPSGEKEDDGRDSLYAEDEYILMRKRRRDAKDSRSGEQPSQEKGRPRREVKREAQKKRANSAKDGKQGSDSRADEGDKHRGQPNGEKKEHLEGIMDEQSAERRGADKVDQVEGLSKQVEDSKEGLDPPKEETDGMSGEIGEGKISDKGGEDQKNEAKNAQNVEPQGSKSSNGKRKKRMRKRMREKLQTK